MTDRDEAAVLSRAAAAMPEAPADATFAARVIATAAATRQFSPAAAPHAPRWTNWVGGVVGFSFGTAIVVAAAFALLEGVGDAGLGLDPVAAIISSASAF